MKQENETQQTIKTLQVPSIISSKKLLNFKYKVLSTITGLHILTYHHELTTLQELVITWITYLFIPILIIIPASILNSNLHPLAVLLPTIVSFILSSMADFVTKRKFNLFKYLCIAIYSYLWSVHFASCRQVLNLQIIELSTYVIILILSIITVLTSASTISLFPCSQFTSSTPNNDSLSVHSTIYCRFYFLAPLLLVQTIIYYCRNNGNLVSLIFYLNFVISFGFVLWWFGWISSFYNMSMWICRNLLNGVVFGQKVNHSGSNYRAKIWWSNYLTLALNILAIGVNIFIFSPSLKPTSKQIQTQHILLVCMSTVTSMITAITVYFYLTLSSCSVRLPFTCKQYFNIIVNISIPIIISLLMVFVVHKIYGGYGNGILYDKSNDFKSEKLTTWIFLLIDVFAYVSIIVWKDFTRVRNIFGMKVCGLKYSTVNIQNTVTTNILKITSSLCIMVLTLRLQNIPVLSSYILYLTPTSPPPDPHVHFFVQYILIPILIYRSYKRTQYFNHSIHITIMIAFVLTFIDSTTYLYESIFVVFAFPFIGDNIFKLLFVSPFSIPEKLQHVNESFLKLLYVFCNVLCGIVYVATLGTLELTMIFGLPIYWCVIPSINSHTPGGQKIKVTPSQPESSSQPLQPTLQQSSSNEILESQENYEKSGEYNLYCKIIKQIPFDIFRNKEPGYYLLRISKYIMMVQICTEFYGIFEVVSFVGLEVQDTTSCHVREGEMIDSMCENTWGMQQNIKCLTCDDRIKSILDHELKTDVLITCQNEMQLIGIIQSQQFNRLYKRCIIKSIIYYYNMMLKQQLGRLGSKQIKQAEKLMEGLYYKIKKDKIQEIYPYQFQKNFQFKVKVNQNKNQIITNNSTNNSHNNNKLPPLNKNLSTKQQNSNYDWGDLVQKNDTYKQYIQPQTPSTINISQTPQSQLHMSIILSIYLHIIGNADYLIPQRIYKMLKRQNPNRSQLLFDKSDEIIQRAVGCGMKLAVNKNIEGESDINIDDIQNYEKNQYLGVKQSNRFLESVERDKKDIWTCSIVKKRFYVQRLTRMEMPLYMFRINACGVCSIWNNLRFELLYAENDNDERYSIQTHKYLMRNLLIEGAQNPYGYAGYYGKLQICI